MQSVEKKSSQAVESVGDEAVCCPACGASGGSSRGWKSGCELFRCRSCGTLFTPQVAGKDEDYESYYHADNLVAPDFVHERIRQIIASFSTFRCGNRLLDLGCGSGVLMQAAAQDGWNVDGVDVSQTAAEHVRSLGYQVFCGKLQEAGFPGESFDVVVASELLEHVPDPQTIINEVARILRPGGLFWASTPHGQGLSAYLLRENWSLIAPPEHRQLFSRAGMRLMLKRAGFRRVRIAAYTVNPAELLHWLRRAGKSRETHDEGFDQLSTSYKLNEVMTTNRVAGLLKYTVNGLLNLGGLGDSLKIRAVR